MIKSNLFRSVFTIAVLSAAVSFSADGDRDGGRHGQRPGNPGGGRHQLVRELDQTRAVIEQNMNRMGREDVRDISALLNEIQEIAQNSQRGRGDCRRERADRMGRVFASDQVCVNGLAHTLSIGTGNSVVLTEVGTRLTKNLGGVVNLPPLGLMVDGVLYIFARGSDNALWYRTMTSGWISLGGYLTSVDTIYDIDGEITMIGKGSDGHTSYSRTMTRGWMPL
jgi:hypothetical protein